MANMKSTSTPSEDGHIDESEMPIPRPRLITTIHDTDDDDDDDDDDICFSDDDDDERHRYSAAQRSAAPSPESPDGRPSSSRVGVPSDSKLTDLTQSPPYTPSSHRAPDRLYRLRSGRTIYATGGSPRHPEQHVVARYTGPQAGTSPRQGTGRPTPEPRPRRIEALRASPPCPSAAPRSSPAPYPCPPSRRPGPSSRSTSSARPAASPRVSAEYLRGIGGLGSSLPRLDPRAALGIAPGHSSSPRLQPLEPPTWTTFEAEEEERARWRHRPGRARGGSGAR